MVYFLAKKIYILKKGKQCWGRCCLQKLRYHELDHEIIFQADLGLNHIHLTIRHGNICYGLRDEKLFSHSMGIIPELIGNISLQLFPLVYFSFSSHFNRNKQGKILLKTSKMIAWVTFPKTSLMKTLGTITRTYIRILKVLAAQRTLKRYWNSICFLLNTYMNFQIPQKVLAQQCWSHRC